MTDKEIGFNACIDAIGRDLYEANKGTSVFACGNDEKGLWCFLGINTSEDNVSELRLTNGDKWEYSVSCYVKEGKAVLEKESAFSVE